MQIDAGVVWMRSDPSVLAAAEHTVPECNEFQSAAKELESVRGYLVKSTVSGVRVLASDRKREFPRMTPQDHPKP